MISERKYIFSGSLTQAMSDHLLRLRNEGKFEPVDVLVSQLDRSSVKTMLKNIEMGVAKSLFIDSGAYSEHSQGIKIDVDEYIEYVNSLDEYIIAAAQVDHIPGVFRQPKKPEDYEESARLSWENFLYMYPKMKSPEKLIAVFHQGESFEHLQNMLDWVDDQGNKLSYIGISPSNDRATSDKDVYLSNVYDFIAKSSNPDVRTHLFGYTAITGLPKFPWYSCDSTSHRLRAAYNKIYTNKWGTISMSRTRSASDMASRHFPSIVDADTLKEFTELASYYGFTLEELESSSSCRTVMDMCEVQRYLREHPYKKENLRRSKRLFEI